VKKKKEMRFLSILSLLLFTQVSLPAQENFFEQPVFSISIYTHSIGIPFKHIIKKPLNLGIAIGAEFSYPNQGKERHVQRVEAGYYFHKHLQKVVWLKTDYVRRFQDGEGVLGEVSLGVGYMRDINAYKTFTKGANGTYQPTKNADAGGLITSLGIGGAYRIHDEEALAPFLRYEGWLQLPYSQLMPFMPHSMLHLGSRF
jgi:hypothetical protein